MIQGPQVQMIVQHPNQPIVANPYMPQMQQPQYQPMINIPTKNMNFGD